MDEQLERVAVAVRDNDRDLANEWWEALDRSRPDRDDATWTALAERITDVSDRVGVQADDLLDRLAAEYDLAPLQALLSGVAYGADPAEEAPAAPTDLGVWNDYLSQNGPRWDGTEESWGAFVDWFVYYADAEGVGAAARSFCDLAAQEGAHAVFARYGVVVPAGAAPGPEAEPAAVPDSVRDTVAEYGPAIVAEFRRDYPQFADLSDDHVTRLLAAALEEQSLTTA